MRLFIAIHCNAKTKDELVALQNRIREYAGRGNFTSYDNLHLTLVFLGEVHPSRIPAIKECMENLASAPFDIIYHTLGYYRRGGKDLWWVGLRKNKELLDLRRNLVNLLSEEGFSIEKRAYSPHLTLAREVEIREMQDKLLLEGSVKPFTSHVDSISLMKSERLHGILTYTEVYAKQLESGS
jgi:RNA 2',3'-cyclic 3'-phosphodiesterase